jgi:hypothetical protein
VILVSTLSVPNLLPFVVDRRKVVIGNEVGTAAILSMSLMDYR